MVFALTEGSAPRRVLWRRGDFILAVAVALAALVLLLVLRLGAPAGQTAVVTTPDGTVTLSLASDTERTFTGSGDIRVTVEVRDGQVRVAQSGCPDQVCVHSGWLSRSGQSAACVPAGIAVQVTGETDDGIDAVAR